MQMTLKTQAVVLVLACLVLANAGVLRLERRGLNGELVEVIPRTDPSTPDAPLDTQPQMAHGRPQFTWTRQNVERNGCIMDISVAPNGKTGLAAGEAGLALRTEDGGQTWRNAMNTSFPYYWYGAKTFNATHGFIGGFINPCTSNCGVIRWTTDGGKTWGADQSVADGWLGGPIEYADQNNGFIPQQSGSAGFRTNDGGKTWSPVVINKEGGWVAGNYRFVRSQPLYITGVQFCTSKNEGYNFTCTRPVDEIFDGGVYFPTASIGYTGGGSIMPEVRGWVHTTQDGGAKWSGRVIQTPFPVRIVFFVNATLGFAAGGNVFSRSGGIYSTTDGGTTWNLDAQTGVEMHGISMVRLPGPPNRVQLWIAGCGQPGGIWTAVVEL